MTSIIARLICATLSLTTIPAAACQYPSRDFFMNSQGGLNSCSRAATDIEVEWCAGELPVSSPANPARFNCRQAEVDSEYQYCNRPYPKARR